MIETSSGLPRKSSVIFGNFRKSSAVFGKFWKTFGNVRVTFGQVLENLRKSSESRRKSSEKCQKHRPPYVCRDFKQRQRGRRRERHKIREKPNGPLRMTGGKQVDVLRSVPTRVKLISRCLKTRIFAFVSSAVSTLNNPCY